MSKKQPEPDRQRIGKNRDKEAPEKAPNAEIQPERDDDTGDEESDLPLKGLGLPDRDLKKNLGCG